MGLDNLRFKVFLSDADAADQAPNLKNHGLRAFKKNMGIGLYHGDWIGLIFLG